MNGGHVIFGFGDTLERQLRNLCPEDQLEFFWAITDYGLYKEERSFEGWKAAVWEGMRDAIDNFAGSKRGAPRGNANAAKGRKDENNSNQIAELNSIQNNSETKETIQKQIAELNSIQKQIAELNSIQKQIAELNSIQNNSPKEKEKEKEKENEKEKEKENEKEKKEGKETSEETNRHTDKVQEDSPFFLDSESLENQDAGEEAREKARGRGGGKFNGDPSADAMAPPSRQNTGVCEMEKTPENSPSQDFAAWFEELRLHWNNVFPEKPCERMAGNLSHGKREALTGTWRTWGADDCKRAVDNHKRARDSPDLYDLKGCEYPTGLIGFLTNGVDAFSGEDALGRFLRRTRKAAQEGARARIKDARKEFDARHEEYARVYKEALGRGDDAEAARAMRLDEEARRSFEARKEELEREGL